MDNIYGIFACDPIGVIGKNGKLPWHYAEDLAHFAAYTRHHTLIMGYKTFISLPKSYFDERQGIVLSRQKRSVGHPNVTIADSLEKCLSEEILQEKSCYVIGGGQIFQLFLEAGLLSQLVVTHIKNRYEGDAFFPLMLIRDWPFRKIRECEDFTIYHYFRPIRDKL